MTIAINGPGTGYGDPYLDSLIYGVRWNPGTLYYYFDSSTNPSQPWTVTETQAFRTALNLYQNITNLHFVETNTQGSANFIWDKWTNAQFHNQGVLGQHD